MNARKGGAHRLWIRDPWAILAADAVGGIVIAGTRIVERVPPGGQQVGLMHGTWDTWHHSIGLDTGALREAHPPLTRHLFGTV